MRDEQLTGEALGLALLMPHEENRRRAGQICKLWNGSSFGEASILSGRRLSPLLGARRLQA
jgi:hypothetical protein